MYKYQLTSTSNLASTMLLKFVPNPAFQNAITKIKNTDLSLVDIQKSLERECPGADINFGDICREMLNQSKSKNEQDPQLHPWAFANQFSQIMEMETCRDNMLSSIIEH